MSKIDYSQFYMKNYMPDKNVKPKKQKNYKEKKSKKGIFVFVLVLIIIASLIYANLKISDFSFDTIKSWFSNKEQGDYYLLIKKFNNRDKAYAQSLLVRQSGASGYIYQDNDAYCVVYTVFLDNEDAKIVARKNPSTEIIVKKVKNNDFNDSINLAIKELIIGAEQLENGEIYEARLLEKCSIIKTQLAEQKTDYLDQDKPQEYIAILDMFIGGLSSLNFPSPTRVSLLSDLRYIISSVVFSCCQ